MAEITLTTHQHDALSWLVTQLCDHDMPLVALTGLAGTGKSTVMLALRQALEARGKIVSIGAPTHRAALVLQQKGITDASTLHSLALVPSFTADYTRCLAWLGEEVPATAPDPEDEAHDDIEGLPYLIHAGVFPNLKRGRALKNLRRQYPIKKVLASVGLHGRDYFKGFCPRVGLGILILDEASMVGQSMLRLCQEAFPQICLVGDPGQLPPVRDRKTGLSPRKPRGFQPQR